MARGVSLSPGVLRLRMRYDRLEHTDRDLAPRDEPRLGAPAGVFLLHGGYHVAALGGRDAARLRHRGALLVAAVHFEAGAAGLAASGGARAGQPPLWFRAVSGTEGVPSVPGSPSGN